MRVRIVTDSVSDLPPDVVKELGIMIVPLGVRFGIEVYRDGIDLTTDQFYEKLKHSKTLPASSVPSPQAFVETYDRLAEETDKIIVITLTSKLSGTYQVALQSIGLMKRKCHVEVIDSQWAIMAQGFIVITAARAAQAGASFDEVMNIIHRNILRVDMRAAFDTLEYLERGGRIGKAQSLIGSILSVNPIIGIRDGEVCPFEREHSRAKAIEHLCNFAKSFSNIEGLAVEYAVNRDEVERVIEQLASKFPKEHIYCSRTSPVIGTHTGPGLLAVSVLGDR
ncbi:MAG: DegV family protein [Dehalococcoidales bacterium]|nr:DegV family protein [Dehalococcoidales bacterium]